MPRTEKMDTWNGNIDARRHDSGEGILITSEGGGAEACLNKITVNINLNIQNMDADQLTKLTGILDQIKHAAVSPVIGRRVEIT